jgi:hypothetical protein
MLTTQQINDLRDRINLMDFCAAHATFSLSGSSANGRLVGPCPVCGGDDRFHVEEKVWHCRQCRPCEPGKRRDLYELIQFLGLAHDFKAAYVYADRWAGGAGAATVAATRHRQPERKPVNQDWLHKLVLQAEHLLTKAPLGMEYLTGRGIAQITAKAFRLGYKIDVKFNGGKDDAPAITIPWLEDGKFTRIGYRFLEPVTDNGKSTKYKTMSGASLPGVPSALFGAQADRNSDTLAILEGEINAVSVWQVTSWNVRSFGSQEVSQEQVKKLKKLADGYKNLMIWADTQEKAALLGAQIGHSNMLVRCSPNNLDCNDLLKMGKLGQFLEKITQDWAKLWLPVAPLPTYGGREGAQRAARAAIDASVAKHGR